MVLLTWKYSRAASLKVQLKLVTNRKLQVLTFDRAWGQLSKKHWLWPCYVHKMIMGLYGIQQQGNTACIFLCAYNI